MAISNKTEATEQMAIIHWCELMKTHYCELGYIYHVPNEGKRSKNNGMIQRKSGLKSGVPDLCLPIGKGAYSALYIELKKDKKCKATQNQMLWIEALNVMGNLAVVCYGFENAVDVIQKYLNLKPDEEMELN